MKISGLEGYGIEIVGREPIEMTCNEKDAFYLYTKYKKMGHMLHVKEVRSQETEDKSQETEDRSQETEDRI